MEWWYSYERIGENGRAERNFEDGDREGLLYVCEGDDNDEISSRENGRGSRLQLRTRDHEHVPERGIGKCAGFAIFTVGLAMIAITYTVLGMKLMHKYYGEDELYPAACLAETVQDEGCPKSFPWHSYRLPNVTQPNRYEIFVHPNLTQGSYTGEVDITITVLKPTNTIVLHSRDINLTKVEAYSKMTSQKKKQKVVEEEEYRVSNYMTCKEFDLLAIVLQGEIIPGEQYHIRIKFNGELKKGRRGFYQSKYNTTSGESRTLAATQFEPTDARSAFPCFDEPAYKANFSISIVRDRKYITLSNMPIGKTENYGDNLKIDKFLTSMRLSTYHVAFVVSDFKHISKTVRLQNGPVKVSIYAPEDKIGATEFALNLSCQSLEFFEKLFRVAYQFPKLDLIAIPDLEAGSMEKLGLITCGKGALLWNPNSSSIFHQERVAMTVAREVAHQWFGNMITMKWWNDLWLSEGFASFMGYYAVDAIIPTWEEMEGFNGEHTLAAMREDESAYRHPISTPVNNGAQIEELFDVITYSKGGCVLKMMIEYVGKDVFVSGVGDYLREFAFHNVANEDLVKAVAARVKPYRQQENVLSMFDSWTTKPGFPVINVSLSGGEVVMTQMRYLLSVEEKEEQLCHKYQNNTFWDIPVSYFTNLSAATKWIFFTGKTMKFSVEKLHQQPEWAIFNVKRSGYYVINYNERMLTKILVQLKKDHTVFSPLDRSGIMFNVAKSAKAGYVSYDILFEMLLYMKNEEEYVPFKTVTDILSGITSIIKLQFEEEVLNKIMIFSKNRLKHLYAKYDWPRSNDIASNLTHLQMKLRKLAILLMCSVDDLACTRNALSLFYSWKQNGTEIHSDYKDVVYSVGVRLGPSENWDFLWNRYTTDLTIDALEKVELLKALCHTTEENKIVFLLDEAMKGENIRFQNTGDVFRSLRSTRIGGLITWDYVRSKWSEIRKIYSPRSTQLRGILSIFNSLIDESDIATAEEFVALHNMTEFRFVKRELNQAKLNVHWIKTYQPQIVDWLNENFDRLS